MKKYSLLLTLGFSVAAIVFLQAFMLPDDPDWDDVIAGYEQNPPAVDSIWVQKLADPSENGPNMIMRIRYNAEEEMPPTLNIYYGEDGGEALYITFHDDGSDPDVTEGDHIYSAFIREDINAFLARIAAAEAAIESNGGYMRYEGHLGEWVEGAVEFALEDFNGYNMVPLSIAFALGLDCETDLKKQNSLFVTDLAVVEDDARTFFVDINTVNATPYTGNPDGVWTFGYMIKNIVNAPHTQITAKEFLKRWLDQWMTPQTINGQTVAARKDVFAHLISPWIYKCNPNAIYQSWNCSAGFTEANWKCKWDELSETDILRFAPFKLTAIVNRLDLRGNPSYTASITDAGETRFIFSLVNPVATNPDDPYYPNNAGRPPYHLEPPNAIPGSGQHDVSSTYHDHPYLDWLGMNIIFEYNNVFATRCEVKDFAQKWLNLSVYTDFADPNYLSELEDISREVIEAGVSTANGNKSAISQIRTNEKIFQRNTPPTGTLPQDIDESWRLTDWEMRQFELDNNSDPNNPTYKYLIPVPVTNTPSADRNYASFDPNNNVTIGTQGSNFTNMWNWINGNKGSIVVEKHNIPATYLSGVARMDAEYLHYFQAAWPTSNVPANFRKIRNKYSLNTCQGCHGGETKTAFTHIRPLGYGQSANYWRAASSGAPDNDTGFIDYNDFPPLHNQNIWQTYNGSTSVDNYPKPEGNRYYQRVSAFLTGRSYTGLKGSGTYQDDLDNFNDNALDHTLDGDFYANDPTNDQYAASHFPDNFPVKTGYNDLKRRKADLCNLLNSNCNGNGSIILEIAGDVSFVAFPIGGH